MQWGRAGVKMHLSIPPSASPKIISQPSPVASGCKWGGHSLHTPPHLAAANQKWGGDIGGSYNWSMPLWAGPSWPPVALWAWPLWAPQALMGWTLMGTMVNQRLGSMTNLLNLLATVKWHKAIYIHNIRYDIYI